MKKRKVSSFYTGLFWFTGVLFLAGVAVFSPWLLTNYVPDDPAHPYDWGFVLCLVFILDCVIGFCCSLYMVLKGMCAARYSVTVGGMETDWRKETYRLSWQDCAEFDIVPVPVNWGSAIFIVYCSTRLLSPQEKSSFLKYHRNDFAHIQYFQYSDDEAFQEFLSCVPEQARNYLEAKAIMLGLTSVG